MRANLLVVLLGLTACGSSPSPPGVEASALELVGLLRDDTALNRPHDVELAGDLAFVPGKGGSVAIIDIADPAQPTLVSHLDGFDDAETVLPIGDGLLLLGTRDFHVLDVSDPTAPQVIESISDRPRIDRINGMVRHGDIVFAACKSGFIAVFDISEPRSPQHIGSFPAAAKAGQAGPHDLDLLGNDRIVVVNSDRRSEAALRVYKVFEAGELLPVDDWEIEGALPALTDTGTTQIGGANRVDASGHLAFLGAFHPDRVAVADLSDPMQPKLLANLPVCDIDATGLAVVGQAVFAAGGICAEAIDASDPNNLVSIAQYRGGELFSVRALQFGDGVRYDNGHDLIYRDGYLYVSAQNDNAFGVLRVNDERVRELAEGPER